MLSLNPEGEGRHLVKQRLCDDTSYQTDYPWLGIYIDCRHQNAHVKLFQSISRKKLAHLVAMRHRPAHSLARLSERTCTVPASSLPHSSARDPTALLSASPSQQATIDVDATASSPLGRAKPQSSDCRPQLPQSACPIESSAALR